MHITLWVLTAVGWTAAIVIWIGYRDLRTQYNFLSNWMYEQDKKWRKETNAKA